MAVRSQRTRANDSQRSGFLEDLRHTGGDSVGAGGSDGLYGSVTESVAATREIDDDRAAMADAGERQWHARLLVG